MIYALGVQYEPVVDWKAILPAIKAPRNYKKQPAIDSYIAARLKELEQGGAADDPVVGQVMDVCVLNEYAEVFRAQGADAGPATLDFFEKNLGSGFSTIIGIQIHRALRTMALAKGLRDHGLPTDLQWALDLGLSRDQSPSPHLVDPIKALFGSSKVDVWAVARRVGYAVPKGISLAENLARLAQHLGNLIF